MISSATASLKDETWKAKLYQPLHDWQIRVLCIEPGRPGSTLYARLHVVDPLFEYGALIHGTVIRIDYHALSYVWGDPHLCRQLRCNGIDVPITQAVFSALQVLRPRDEALYIWIDLLCINQSDTLERSRQVQKMVSIYKKALSVKVWLGEEGKHTKALLQHLLIASGYDQDGEATIIDHVTPEIVHGLEDFLKRDWFVRVWTMQEVWATTAPSVDIWCGSYSFRADLLNPFSNTGMRQIMSQLQLPHDLRHEGSSDRTFQLLRTANRRLQPGSRVQHALAGAEPQANWQLDESDGNDIINILRNAVGSVCSDPRDHIYGLIGMSNCVTTTERYGPPSLTSTTFTIDYRLTASQVFQALTFYLIRREQSLAVLHLPAIWRHEAPTQARGLTSRLDYADLALPSWVPDWRHATTGLQSKYRVYENAIAPSWLELSRANDGTVEHVPTEGILRIRGKIVGLITEVSPFSAHFSKRLPEYWAQGQLATLDGKGSHPLFVVSGIATAGDRLFIWTTSSVPLVIRRSSTRRHKWERVGSAIPALMGKDPFQWKGKDRDDEYSTAFERLWSREALDLVDDYYDLV
jgi:hypothetical protein